MIGNKHKDLVLSSQAVSLRGEPGVPQGGEPGKREAEGHMDTKGSPGRVLGGTGY